MLSLTPLSGASLSDLGVVATNVYEGQVDFVASGTLAAAGSLSMIAGVVYTSTGTLVLGTAGISLLGAVVYDAHGFFSVAIGGAQLVGQVLYTGSLVLTLGQPLQGLNGRVLYFGALTFQASGFGESPGYLPGTREFQNEFEDPETVISGRASTSRRPDALTFDYLTAFSLGPVAIADVTGGVVDRAWYVRCDNVTKTVYIASSNSAKTAWLTETILFQFVGEDINELDLAFEQAARAVVCAERTILGSKEVWMYWFDPGVSDFVFEKFDDGRTPRVVLDDVEDTSGSDIQLMYFKSGEGLVRREQRDAYAVMYNTPILDNDNYFLEELAITKSRRMAAIYSFHDTVIGRWFLLRLQSALYPVYPRDEFTAVWDILDGSLIVVLIEHSLFDKDTFDSGLDFLTASTLASIIIDHTLFDKDTFDSELDILVTSTLIVVLIIHNLFDKDTFDAELDILATSTLVQIVIEHLLFDKDTSTSSLDVIATGSALEVA